MLYVLISTKKQWIEVAIDRLIRNRQEKRKNFRIVDKYPQIKKDQGTREISIIGNELLVLISLVDLARQLGGISYTIALHKIARKCGLCPSEAIRHLQSLHQKAVITVKKQNRDQKNREKQRNQKNQKNELSLYQIELVESSAIYEPISVRFYPSIKKGDQSYVR